MFSYCPKWNPKLHSAVFFLLIVPGTNKKSVFHLCSYLSIPFSYKSIHWPSLYTEQVQLPQLLLVSHELPTSCYFGRSPVDLLQFLHILLQLGSQTRHSITDTLLINGHQLAIKPLTASLWEASIKGFFWTARILWNSNTITPYSCSGWGKLQDREHQHHDQLYHRTVSWAA